MNTNNLTDALVLASRDEALTDQLNKALRTNNVGRIGGAVLDILTEYKKGTLKGQQVTIYDDMLMHDRYRKVAETAIIQHAGLLVEVYDEGSASAVCRALSGIVEDDLFEHMAEFEEE